MVLVGISILKIACRLATQGRVSPQVANDGDGVGQEFHCFHTLRRSWALTRCRK